MKYSCLILFWLVILFSCGRLQNPVMPEAAMAECMLEDNPDSLACILEKINPEAFPDSSKAYYWWLLIHAHARSGRSLVNDSLIYYSVQYYKEQQSPRLALAYFLAGAYEYKKSNGPKNYDTMERMFLKALNEAENQKDTTLLQRLYTELGYSYFVQQKHAKTISINKEALTVASPQSRALAWFDIAVAYATLRQLDSALFYMEKSIALGHEVNSRYQFDYLRNYADLLSAIDGRGKEGLAVLEVAKKQFSGSKEWWKAGLSYVVNWLNVGNLDSAEYYLHQAEEISRTAKSPWNVNQINRLMGYRLVLDAKKGLIPDFAPLGQYNDSISNAIGQMMMLDNERVVAQATLEKDKLMLEVEKGDLQQGYLWMLVGVLVLIGFLIYFYQRRLLEKERSIQRAKEQIYSYTVKLVENETVIRDNEELIRDISTQLDESAELKDHLNEQISEIKQISLNNEILQKQNEALQSNINEYTLTLLEKDRETDTYQRLAEQIAFLQGREKFLSDQLINHIDTLNTLKQSPQYIADEQWPEIINIINLLYNNFTNRLHIDCPSLTEEDLHYCCLIKLRLSTSAIARQTAISPTSVTKRKQRIKEKINQYKKEPLGKDQSVETYLWSY